MSFSFQVPKGVNLSALAKEYFTLSDDAREAADAKGLCPYYVAVTLAVVANVVRGLADNLSLAAMQPVVNAEILASVPDGRKPTTVRTVLSRLWTVLTTYAHTPITAEARGLWVGMVAALESGAEIHELYAASAEEYVTPQSAYNRNVEAELGVVGVIVKHIRADLRKFQADLTPEQGIEILSRLGPSTSRRALFAALSRWAEAEEAAAEAEAVRAAQAAK